jgi:hypothetical protein
MSDPKCRILEAFEYMRLIGWFDSEWRVPAGTIKTTLDLELVANMAGNAYSLFHYGPLQDRLLNIDGTWLHG